jgi:hypothetical protein
MKCNAPFGLANSLIGDSQITASSSKDANSQPSQARLLLQPTGSFTGSWCAANNQKVWQLLLIIINIIKASSILIVALRDEPFMWIK